MNKKLFYLLSFTWGLPLTIVGCLVALALLILGYKPRRHGWCLYFELGQGWGGLNLGPLFFCSTGSGDFLKTHEFGHGIQNCYFGPITPFVVHLPSAIRFWYREFLYKRGKTCSRGYYDIWFEAQANGLGRKHITKSKEV